MFCVVLVPSAAEGTMDVSCAYATLAPKVCHPTRQTTGTTIEMFAKRFPMGPHTSELKHIIDKLYKNVEIFLKAAVRVGGQAMDRFEQRFATLLEGEMDDEEAAAFLVEPTPETVAASDLRTACGLLRGLSVSLTTPPGTIDVCGTGGDGRSTLNVSTAVALVVAAAGVPVAKHGNRAASSKSGATDVLQALGIATDLPPARAQEQLENRCITFLAAPSYHPALARLIPLRRRIGRRTIFNMLGPLLNPGHVTRQLAGVYAPEWIVPIAETLRDLGSEHAWVVHGDGLDEIAVSGTTRVARLDDGAIDTFDLDPRDHGIPLWPLSAIAGGTPHENAAALTRLLEGQPGAYSDIVCLNGAAALSIAGKVGGLGEGLALCRRMLTERTALTLMRTLQEDSKNAG